MLFAEEISSGLKRMAVSIIFLSGLYVAVKVRFLESAGKVLRGCVKPFLKKCCALFFGAYGIVVVIWFIGAMVPTFITFEPGGVVILDYISIRPPSSHYLLIENYGFTRAEVLGTPDALGLAGRLAQQQRSLFITMIFFSLTTFFMILSRYP